MNFEEITLSIKDKQDITFNGKLACKSFNTHIYETQKGHWLLAEGDGFGTYDKYVVIEDKDQGKLVALLGYSSQSKSIYQQLGLDITKKLEI
ncbi:hypothetical protein [Pectobacterium atrosepticum]|uniref:hypothetical protein n=1 Tax=Pectobacterium atrosepticum TaxID=29471 RepID=UPI000CDDD29A|nr:hypothetical protein [Pectobacterium atrosepticum]POW23578.1 hypothetical protein PB72LOC_04492 [Pectobacterium atrosepticum]